MAEAIVSPFVQKPADYTIAAISLQFKYMFRYNRNIQNLSSKVQDLENKRNEVQLSVDQAKSNALVINPEVDAWLKKVDDLKEQADEFLNSTTNSEMRCLYLRCPNLKTRYLLSRNATKKITAIDELQVKGDKLGEVGVRAPLQLLPVHGSEALKSRISTKKEIIKALEDTRISIVGIYGLPGVGKTTMAQEVMTQVLKDKLFDEVAKVVVSKDVDIIRIQYELAEMLDLSINVTKMRILVILDDVWTDINLETLGIPSLNRPEGLKILLTSRDKLVLERMGARNIEVGVLSGEEAFAFFQNVAKISNDATGLKDIAEQVAEECKGLPLALEVVGKTLVNRELYVWRDALNQLRHYQHGDEVYSRIQFSYNYLESDEHRSFLLLCSLFPEDESISIESLVTYARGLELFQYTDTLLATRNRAYTISDTLKSRHLLLSGDRGEDVKLHDVIRDFCLSIASKREHRYMAKHDITTEWLEHDNHESYGAISLTFQGEVSLPSSLQYGNLKFLWVQSFRSGSVIDIPEDFFDYMQELRVIHFSGVQIPSPIRLPPGLRTLCLFNCDLEIGLSFFESLKKLEILLFVGSSVSIDFRSDEMVELSNLRSLGLGLMEDPHILPPGLLFGIKKLEELYLGSCLNTIDEENEHIIKELSSLKDLKTFQIKAFDARVLTQLLQECSEQLEKLERFQICMNFFSQSDHFRRELNLHDIDGNMLLEPGIKSLMRRTDKLSLSVEGWNNPVIELVEDGFSDLKSLKLTGLDSEYLIDATGSIPSGIFGNLKYLELISMRYLKEIHNGNLPRMEPAPFRNLKETVVDSCPKIKRVFSESVAKCMVNLRSVDISSCLTLEEVVSMDTQENEITESPSKIVFGKLRRIKLMDLPRFKMFCSHNRELVFPSLDQMIIQHCPEMTNFYFTRDS
ncbi:probable disease resistance protein At4g27220 [Olea europaea var. sylvestris]|uniref:Disease resistance At4g27190-like n=1 Tax=Olea europaea subsp. europaea TaxID=158383 RepID=A0A8S0PQQ6_OLEEU|nr:probable disease resistance protein At4g27220 [Olea europaea var. sylvestris]CAA2956225.1 disease resistance At4g27190-like [Olea europaea subsp. europaea]